VVVPTRNEAGNVVALVAALDRYLAGQPAQVLFVDDSTDNTPEVVLRAAEHSALPVRLLHRPEGERTGGLGGAVVAGLRQVNTPWAVVMDGDLQHPPDMPGRLVAQGLRQNADVVVGSRYLPDGGHGGLPSASRVVVSRGAHLVTRLLFPRRMRGVTDSMSGLFAVRLAALDGVALRPDGFKILLEVLARTPGLRVHEVPFVFGESKASLREGLRFARHGLRLRLSVLGRGRLAQALAFGAVGVTGIAVNAAAFLMAQLTGLHYLLAAIVATQVSTLWNFAGTDRLVFRASKRRGLLARLVPFAAVNEALLVLRIPLIALLVAAGLAAVVANILTLLFAFILRFVISERLFHSAERAS
jgi:putative flippase GtrA